MKRIEKELINIYRSLINKEFVAKKVSEEAHQSYRLSAMNLVRYITLRNQDLRGVHDHLSELGLSSLRSCEGYVMHNVVSVVRLLKLLGGEVWEPTDNVEFIGYKRSKKLLRKHTRQLFDNRKKDSQTKIMVTLPTELADDPAQVRSLIENGMAIARINLSHDNIATWKKMVHHVKEQSEALDKKCLLYMDLSGPKIRIGNISVKDGKKTKDFIRLKKGDHLILSADETVMKDAVYGKNGELVKFPSVSVSLPSIIADAEVGHRVYFDDGKIEGKVIEKGSGKMEVIIVAASDKGTKLKSKMGLNLPDTRLKLPSLTETDIQNLPFVMDNADIMGYSFVRTVEDVKELHRQMEQFDRKDIGVVLKIENQESFENLPMLLLEAMKKPRLGVMIARGDLAVEMGAVRIAEVQEQIMWICEAAHIPVIWATQVLEGLAKTGNASRAEITDAAKSARAECVMLNKGPYILEAVATLQHILSKMKGHTSKKKSVMRALKVSQKNIDRMGMS